MADASQNKMELVYRSQQAEQQVTQFFIQDSATQTDEANIVSLTELLIEQRKLKEELQQAKSQIGYLQSAAPLEHNRTIKKEAEMVYRRLRHDVDQSTARNEALAQREAKVRELRVYDAVQGIADARDVVADGRVADVRVKYDHQISALKKQLAERDAEYLLIQEDVVRADDLVTKMSKQMINEGVKPIATKAEKRRLVDVTQLRNEVDIQKEEIDRFTSRQKELDFRNTSLHAKVTTCKALMADQHQKFGNERNELNAEVTRLNARVDELEYQMLHGGSDAEKAIRAQMMEAYTVKLKEEFNQEMIAQEQRNKKSMHMVQDKARADEQKLIDKNFKQMADLTSRYEREKQQLVQKMEEQHKIELGRMEKMWGVRCEVSQAAVNTLNNEALAASVVERQERILAKINLSRRRSTGLGSAISPLPAIGDEGEHTEDTSVAVT